MRGGYSTAQSSTWQTHASAPRKGTALRPARRFCLDRRLGVSMQMRTLLSAAALFLLPPAHGFAATPHARSIAAHQPPLRAAAPAASRARACARGRASRARRATWMFCGPRRRAAAAPPPRLRPPPRSHRGAAATTPCARRRAPPVVAVVAAAAVVPLFLHAAGDLDGAVLVACGRAAFWGVVA